MDTLVQGIRYAVRALRGSPGFAVVACSSRSGLSLPSSSRLMDGLVYGVRPLDPISILAHLLFLIVALLASYLPARRAARLNRGCAPSGVVR